MKIEVNLIKMNWILGLWKTSGVKGSWGSEDGGICLSSLTAYCLMQETEPGVNNPKGGLKPVQLKNKSKNSFPEEEKGKQTNL